MRSVKRRDHFPRFTAFSVPCDRGCSRVRVREKIGSAEPMPRHRRELRSQLERAAMSVPLNIAEGCGKPTPAERARYHAIARGSAMECGALLDVCGLMGHATAEQVETGKRLLARAVAMLTKMCR